MGSSRWFIVVVAVSCVLTATVNSFAKYPFINDTRAFEMQEKWQSLYPQAILLDDLDRATIFWSVGFNCPISSTNSQVYYGLLDAFATPLTEPALVTDTARYGTITRGFPGNNATGKWAYVNCTEWEAPNCPPNCPGVELAWFSDENGILLDTPIVVGNEVEPVWANLMGSADVDSSGRSVVAWANASIDGTIWCQIYSPEGQPLSDTIRVQDNSCTYDSVLYDPEWPIVAVAPSGDFVVVFDAMCDECEPGNMMYDVLGRAFHADGTPKTDVLCLSCWGDSVNTYWNGGRYPRVTIENDGDFAVCWSQTRDADRLRVLVRRFRADGTPKGPQMVLEDGIYSSSWWQWIVGDSVGNLVVAWQGVLNQGTPDPRYKFWAQRFDTAGNVVGAKFQINDDDHYWNGGAHVAMNNNGLVTFLWSQAFPTGESYNVVQFMDLQDVGIYIPGDANNDRVVNISDAVCLISYIFAGGYAPANTCLGDADGNGIVNVADAVTLISYIFAGGTISGGCPR